MGNNEKISNSEAVNIEHGKSICKAMLRKKWCVTSSWKVLELGRKVALSFLHMQKKYF